MYDLCGKVQYTSMQAHSARLVGNGVLNGKSVTSILTFFLLVDGTNNISSSISWKNNQIVRPEEATDIQSEVVVSYTFKLTNQHERQVPDDNFNFTQFKLHPTCSKNWSLVLQIYGS